MRQIREYGPFTLPVDPAQVRSLTDMDLSYGLASRLVEWDDQKQIVSGLAKSWKRSGPAEVTVQLRSDLKWSSGEPLTNIQVKKSLERGLRKYPQDLRSLAQLIKDIAVGTQNEIVFHTSSENAADSLLPKLTEPQFGISFVKPDDSIDLSKTSGAFILKSQSPDEVTLRRNPHWFGDVTRVVDEVVIRKPSANFDKQRALLNDDWANVAQVFSLMPKAVMDQYERGSFSILKRPVDTVYLFTSSKSLIDRKQTSLLRFLDQHLDRKRLTDGVAGFQVADQIIPQGYDLHDPSYRRDELPAELPSEFKKRPIVVLCPGGNPQSAHLIAFQKEIARVVGIPPIYQCVPFEEGSVRIAKGDYDIVFGAFGVADPHAEGLMSFYFEGDSAVIPANAGNLRSRLDSARNLGEQPKRLQEFRSILRDAKEMGFTLPVLHLSLVGFARKGIDLSQVPRMDESLTLSKIRMKD